MNNQNCNNVVPFPELESSARVHHAKSILLQCLMEGEGEPIGLSYEKFVGRCNSIREVEGKSGKFIVSVERHRAIAGCEYRKGLPMAAYETYHQELLFDPESKEISNYQNVHVGCHINVYGLASEHMDEYRPSVEMRIDGEGGRRVGLTIINWSIETSSREEARSALENEIRSLNHEIGLEPLEISDEEKSDYVQGLEDECVEIVLSRFDEAWENPEWIEDDSSAD